MNKLIRLFSFILFFFSIGAIIAQPTEKQASYIVSTQGFTTEDGLSHRRARAFTQDMSGFMWIGTPYGLNRYDGYQFKVYTQKKGKLQGNNIANVVSTADSLLWVIYSRDIRTWSAIDVFDPIKGIATPLETYFKNALPFEVKDVGFLSFVENEDRSIWFSTKHKVFEYDGRKIRCIATFPDSLRVKGFAKTSKNTAKTNNGLGWVQLTHSLTNGISFVYLDDKGNRIDQTPIYPEIKDRFANGIINTEKDGTLLFYLNVRDEAGELVSTTYRKRLNTPVEKFNYSTNKAYRYQRYAPFYQQVWCSGDTGPVDVFDLEGNFIYQFDLGKSFVIFPYSSYFDRQGGYWLSFNSGLSLTHNHLNLFQQYIHNNKKIGRVGCRGIVEDQNGRLYINNHRGSFFINDKNKKEEIAVLPNSTKFYHNIHLDTALRVALLMDADNSVWLTDQFHRLLHYFPEENRIEFFAHENVEVAEQFKKTSISMNWTLFKDYKDKIWIGQNAGISYLDRDEKLLVKLKDYGKFNLLEKSEVFHFYENKQGIWLATTTGLYLANRDMKILEHFSTSGDKEHYLPYDIIAHLHEDKEGVFWLASKGGGLIKWNPKTKASEQFTVEEGLSHNVLYAVYGDDYNHLWLSSDMGLMKMNKENYSFKNYLPKDGVTHEEFNTTSHCKGKDGTLYFGGLNGVTAFHPKDFVVSRKKSSSRVMISSFTKYNSKESNKIVDLTESCIQKKQINIFSGDRTAILRFSVLDYQRPKAIIYAYKVEGLDKDWQYTSNPELNLIGLPKGEHILWVKTQDEHVEPLILSIHVHPPIYLRTWFIVLFVCLLTFLVYWYIKRRERSLIKQKERLEIEVKARTHKIQQQTEDLKALDQLKSRFFANISHELRTPLTLILGPLSTLLEKKKYKEDQANLKRIERNGKHLLQIVEQILDLSKLDANQLDLNHKPTDLNEFVRYVFSAFDSQGTFQEVDYNLEYNIEGDKKVLLDRDKISKILNNFLSNAFKFTGKDGTITLRVGAKDTKVKFDVIDTGKGIHPDDLPHIFERFYQTKQNPTVEGGTGIGLAFCKELVELMNGSLSVESTLGAGATFSLVLDLEEVVVEQKTLEVEVIPEVIYEEEILELENTVLKMPSGRFTVLLVEDNKDMQDYIKEILSVDYKVITCNNGQIGLDHLMNLDNSLPDIIVSDVMMPEMDGFTLLKHCKEKERLCSIPMIMLTARSATEDKLNALRIGVDDYLTKPFLVDELLIRVKNLLKNVQNRSVIITNEEKQTKSKEETSKTNQVSENDLNWMKEVEVVGLESADDPDFDTEEFAKKVGMSRRNLQRRLKKVTGLTPGQYLREVRLEMARGTLERGVYQTIAEVAYASGFTTPYYFSQIYEKRFGKKVSSYF